MPEQDEGFDTLSFGTINREYWDMIKRHMIKRCNTRTMRNAMAVSLLMLAALPVKPVMAQSDQWNALYDRIIRLEHQMRSGQGAGPSTGGDAGIQQQLQQLSAQVAAMQQQMVEMQRELNRLRELERQGLLFKNRRTAAVIAPQQQPQQWNQGQVAPDYGQMQQSVTIEGEGNTTGQLPRGGLASGPQTLGTLTLHNDQTATPYQPQQPQLQQQVQPYQPPQPQQFQQQAAPQPILPQQQWQPRQVQGVQSNTLPPPPGTDTGTGTASGAAPGGLANSGVPQYQLQAGPHPYQPPLNAEEPAFDAEGRPSLAPERVETAVLDGGNGSNNLAAGDTTSGGRLDDAAGLVFLEAKSSYTSRDFTGAVSGFRTFILRHKDHELADDAQFLLGEAYYAQQDWKLAAQSYLSGYQNFPDGDKRGESLLKLGMSLNKLGQKKQACATFAEVNKKFAKQAAVRNASIKEMQRAGCS